jgi:hypothetical protein
LGDLRDGTSLRGQFVVTPHPAPLFVAAGSPRMALLQRQEPFPDIDDHAYRARDIGGHGTVCHERDDA